MKKLVYLIAVMTALYSCKTQQTRQQMEPVTPQVVEVNMDLTNVKEDKVKVTVNPGRFTTNQTTFYIPKTIPGTYSVDNYGRLIEDIKAVDYLGKELLIVRNNDNSWLIEDAKNLDKITYWVNDSYDEEGEKGIFSPAGTNIEENKNYLLNLHGYVGYFEDLKEQPYKLIITHPADLYGGTSLNVSHQLLTNQPGKATDTYSLDRYFQVVDNPIMYSAPDTTNIMVDDMNVLLHLYSPNNVYDAQTLRPGIAKMITAQKAFLGDLDVTPAYSILLYLSDLEKQDARGYGALEHHKSTVVVLPEAMPLANLSQTMTDVVSHEFFHILTPLNIHSKEIHYFNYNDPEMSKHLWMYEGVTEYFANLFQVNQELIGNDAFYNRMASKIENSKNYTDTIPFTKLSEHILEEPYKDEYYNVYLKGALIGMALDIRLRELSNGDMGVLDLMKRLSERYGKDRPFDDDELIPAIVEMTYPGIQNFFDSYVSGGTPIPYDNFLNKVGLQLEEEEFEVSFFIKGQTPYIDANPKTGELFFRENITLNTFLQELGVKGGDVIVSVNGKEYNVQNAFELVMTSQSWQEEDDISMTVKRNGEEIELSGKVMQPKDTRTIITEMDLPQDDQRVQLRESWLKS